MEKNKMVSKEMSRGGYVFHFKEYMRSGKKIHLDYLLATGEKISQKQEVSNNAK